MTRSTVTVRDQDLEEADRRTDRATFRVLQRNLFMDAGYEYDRIMDAGYEYRLEYRNTMQRLESYRGLRKKGD